MILFLEISLLYVIVYSAYGNTTIDKLWLESLEESKAVHKLESIEKAFVSRLCVGVDDKSAF